MGFSLRPPPPDMNDHRKYTDANSDSARHLQYFQETRSEKVVPLVKAGQCLHGLLGKDTNKNFHSATTSNHDVNQPDMCIHQSQIPTDQNGNLLHFGNQHRNEAIEMTGTILDQDPFFIRHAFSSVFPISSFPGRTMLLCLLVSQGLIEDLTTVAEETVHAGKHHPGCEKRLYGMLQVVQRWFLHGKHSKKLVLTLGHQI